MICWHRAPSSVYLFILIAFNLQHIKRPIKAIKLNNNSMGDSKQSTCVVLCQQHVDGGQREEKCKNTSLLKCVSYSPSTEICHVRDEKTSDSHCQQTFWTRKKGRLQCKQQRQRTVTFLNAHKNLHLNESIIIGTNVVFEISSHFAHDRVRACCLCQYQATERRTRIANHLRPIVDRTLFLSKLELKPNRKMNSNLFQEYFPSDGECHLPPFLFDLVGSSRA